MGYFRTSQQIKEEIRQTHSLIERIRDAFSARIEGMDSGGTIDFYCIGRTDTGVYVGLRSFRRDVHEGQMSVERQKRYLEKYCQNAEVLSSKGESVPAFCIGVVCNGTPGILT